MTGSANLDTQGTTTVPTAMLCAASSIHHSSLSHTEPPCARASRPLPEPLSAPASVGRTYATSPDRTQKQSPAPQKPFCEI